MTEPTTTFAGECKFMTLAGKKWPVPVLGPRYNRVLVPLLNRIFAGAVTDGKLVMSTENYDAMNEVVFTALSKLHKDMTMDDFLDLPATHPELITALFVAVEQTGLEIRQKAGVPTPGEAQAESQSTGTE